MKRANWLASAIAVLVLGLLAPAQAAPASGTAGSLHEAASENAGVTQVRHRCYWHRGHWHCPRHRYYHHYYGPEFYFNLGPRRHHHRHHHRRHWN